jgi:hypothetical protein
VPAHDPDAGLVARRLDAEDEGPSLEISHVPIVSGRSYFQTLT